ncbi:MAG: DUF502 domain-containing protein [Candidatus Scalindua sp.]|nr:DUF502 domain-containing protein [Candidatus Scalindua sp.]
MKHHLRKHLLAGIFVILPVGITLFILKFLLNISAGNLVAILVKYWDDAPAILLWFISLVIFILIVYLLGLITAHIIGRRLIVFGENIIMEIPLLKTIYGVSKQVVSSFVDQNRVTFKSVALIEFPTPGVRTFGFITGSIEDTQGQKCYKVFVPTTPNPTSGFFLIVSEDAIQHTSISVENCIKLIISGGIISPSSLRIDSMNNEVV